ncbi:MAG: TenA family protein [Rhodospirillaceae bacterium]|nr:TenA family protein [Rhodospirillaceae bacterium]
MTFSESVWAEAALLRQAIKNLAFNRELAAGTLARETFQFYILQDSIYLEAYSRALSLASAKAPDTDAMLEFSGAAMVAIQVERALHAGFFKDFGIGPDARAATEPSPTCLNYTNFLLATAATGSYAELVAGILPCFWVYWEVGNHIAGIAKRPNPYDAWINTYADQGFGDATRRVIALTDRIAAREDTGTLANMRRAFLRCTQFEWMFWDSAYKQERWPV